MGALDQSADAGPVAAGSAGSVAAAPRSVGSCNASMAYGEAKAVAYSGNGARAVAGGRSGDKGAMWFSRISR